MGAGHTQIESRGWPFTNGAGNLRENVTDTNNLRQLGKDIGLKMIVDKQTKIYSGGDMGDWDATLKLSKKLCDGLSEDDDGLKREILTHAGDLTPLRIPLVS